MVNFAIRLKSEDPQAPCVLLELSLFDFVAILNLIFLKPTLVSFSL